MKKAASIDLRVMKSQRAIRRAFWKLMEEGGFHNVTVARIINLAEMNRSTFYAHYSDKYDLLDNMENELLSGVMRITLEAPAAGGANVTVDQDAFIPYIMLMLEYFKENGTHFILLSGEDGDPAFRSKLNQTIETIWKEHGLVDRMIVPEHYLVTGVSGMMTNLIAEWADSGFKEDVSDFAMIVERFIMPLIKSVVR